MFSNLSLEVIFFFFKSTATAPEVTVPAALFAFLETGQLWGMEQIEMDNRESMIRFSLLGKTM